MYSLSSCCLFCIGGFSRFGVQQTFRRHGKQGRQRLPYENVFSCINATLTKEVNQTKRSPLSCPWGGVPNCDV